MGLTSGSVEERLSDPRDSNRRVVLIGASNIARSLPIVLNTARDIWGSPIDIMAAHGHGRSYGMTSSVLGRTLPGILQSGLWDALAERPNRPTAVLLTDIGNDILYGASVSQIASWVESCLLRLEPVADRITVTQLPIDSLVDVGKWRFLAMRTILFPKSQLKFHDALERANELNERVKQLAEQCGAMTIEPVRCWYGIDPIHIKRRYQAEAWKRILSAWTRASDATYSIPIRRERLKILGIRPQSRYLFGFHQRQKQPVTQLSDSSFVSLY